MVVSLVVKGHGSYFSSGNILKIVNIQKAVGRIGILWDCICRQVKWTKSKASHSVIDIYLCNYSFI